MHVRLILSKEAAMYYLVTDETNLEQSGASKFFIYGGLILSSKQMIEVTDAISGIRDKYGYRPHDQLKFDTNCRPAHVSIDDAKLAKNEVILACHASGVHFIAYLILHAILQAENKNAYALNSVLCAFDKKFLAQRNDRGIVLTDRLPDSSDAYTLLKSKFQEGLKFPDNAQLVPLDRVLMYGTTCDGASHISSAVDIVLGGFRWVVNSKDKSISNDTPKIIMKNIVQMMYTREGGDVKYVRDYGLILRPRVVAAPAYKAEYDSLMTYFRTLIDE
ncbi:hypothetical protein NLX83_01645 [Allokutzneria sp. A3M-2-11 16]|uniref:hypothetical protein n=1 Tax=Allokutzneria sp. A3M-2-11 16 TaxID=2962043 RepID=UPI0020B88E7F|nr:hypothetical protein [Allokutzneria sp. A3M-2-11 16]MCP3797952.1 hypothetical protein [Allokutzneria sp. A3M-2-11 16]